MLQRFAFLGMILFATATLADVCSFITKEQAELGERLIRIHPRFVKYCATCPDKSKTKIRAEKVDALPIGHEQYWGLFVNKQNIDLAYTYLDIGENVGINLAILSGCETPSDVPRRIDLNDVASESKIAAPEKPKESSESEVTAPTVEAKETSVVTDKKPVTDADQYFQKKDFAKAVRLYEDYVEKNPTELNAYKPKIVKCYYNLGVQTIQRASTRKDCAVAGDYFSHCLYLDQTDAGAAEALRIANVCKQLGPNLPKVESEIDDLELRH